METLIAIIEPRSAFGGPMKGDTLFGQLCWAARHRWGEERLDQLLQGYADGKPFAVVSDAFPKDHLPRPAMPLHRFDEVPGIDRKQVKKRDWLPREHFPRPLSRWLEYAVTENQIAGRQLRISHTQPHNTINRLTGTTGSGEFAPYAMEQHWFAPQLRFELYIAHDRSRLTADEIHQLLEDVGQSGYGRDTSIGLGKFNVASIEARPWPAQEGANACLTLAPCAPQGLAFDPEKSWYQPFVRFGRHGDLAVHTGRPFKNPVLMADTGALLTPVGKMPACFTGQGLGGDGRLSRAIEKTVHQGYAPVLPVRLEEIS